MFLIKHIMKGLKVLTENSPHSISHSYVTEALLDVGHVDFFRYRNE